MWVIIEKKTRQKLATFYFDPTEKDIIHVLTVIRGERSVPEYDVLYRKVR